MVLQSTQLPPLDHVIDFARIVRASTDGELGSSSNTPYCPTVIADVERLLELPLFTLIFQSLVFYYSVGQEVSFIGACQDLMLSKPLHVEATKLPSSLKKCYQASK